MISEKILQEISRTDLKELGMIFTMLAERIYEYRQTHKGLVPPEIFKACQSMAGMCVSVQIVNEVVDKKGKRIGFALRQRENNEQNQSWIHLFHNTCTVGRIFDTPTTALERDTIEAYGKPKPNEKLEFLGAVIYDEPERMTARTTIMHRRRITLAEVESFVGHWQIFTEKQIKARDKRIVDHNCYQLEWVMDENRPSFADVRGGWKKSKK